MSVARSDPHPRLFTVRADEGILEQVRGHDFLCGANYKEEPLCGEKSACDKRMADRQGRGDKGRPVPEKDSRMLFADSVSVVAAVVPENLTTGCAASGVAEFVYPLAITSLAWPRGAACRYCKFDKTGGPIKSVSEFAKNLLKL